ncbi:FecCD family ABC transporter permease [Vibrio sonorensis]|uniref:FecCD family ABC transporter permease n=1 Tax=Vibrio sonorensis TaxID=1004316 RepID=UPI0008D998AA|nr:iron ABC transporter permease [Vibrio sonorensis]
MKVNPNTAALDYENLARQQKSYLRKKQFFIVAALILTLLLMLANVFVGSRGIAPEVTLDALLRFDASNTEHLLVQHIRIPRTFLAVIVGAALAVSGVLMQALTRNPLADPGLLGVNAGAMLAVVSAIAVFGWVEIHQYIGVGLAGAGLAGLTVYLLAGMHREINPVKVVLAGSALTVVLLAITHIVTLNSSEQVFDQYRHWSVGSLQGRDMDVVVTVLPLVVLGVGFAFAVGTMLDSLVLGNHLGASLGVNANRVWLLSCVAIMILSGSATAAAGPISFLGLTAPHLARFIIGAQHSWLIPFSALLGAVLVLVADIVGKIVGAPGEVSVGVMLALIGGPCFVFMVRRWKLAQL